MTRVVVLTAVLPFNPSPRLHSFTRKPGTCQEISGAAKSMQVKARGPVSFCLHCTANLLRIYWVSRTHPMSTSTPLGAFDATFAKQVTLQRRLQRWTCPCATYDDLYPPSTPPSLRAFAEAISLESSLDLALLSFFQHAGLIMDLDYAHSHQQSSVLAGSYAPGMADQSAGKAALRA